MAVFKTPEETNYFAGKLGKILQLYLSQRSNENLFLIAAEDHDVARRCEEFIKFKIVHEEGNKLQKKTEIIVEAMKEFKDKPHF